jgi:hypothetical protein
MARCELSFPWVNSRRGENGYDQGVEWGEVGRTAATTRGRLEGRAGRTIRGACGRGTDTVLKRRREIAQLHGRPTHVERAVLRLIVFSSITQYSVKIPDFFLGIGAVD